MGNSVEAGIWRTLLDLQAKHSTVSVGMLIYAVESLEFTYIRSVTIIPALMEMRRQGRLTWDRKDIHDLPRDAILKVNPQLVKSVDAPEAVVSPPPPTRRTARGGAPAPASTVLPETGGYRYDAFISYRHGDPDEAFARRLLADLEAAGFTLAIDKRDFAPAQDFLDEMERCIAESRFSLAVITPRYFESGNTTQEARIRKVRDMADMEHRLIPLTLEKTKLPTWLYAITGVDFTEAHPLVEPMERLKQALRP